MDQNQGQHPDWAAIQEGHRLLSDNMHLLANVQPFNQAELMNEIRAFREEVRTDMAGLRGDVAGIRGDIAGIRRDIAADRFNAFARTRNASALVPNAPLTCLRDIQTNAPILNFPRTTGGIDNLSGADVTRILRALGLHADDNPSDRRESLQRAIGIPYRT